MSTAGLAAYLAFPVVAQDIALKSAVETDPVPSIATPTVASAGSAADLRLTPSFSADFNSPRNGDNGRSFTRINGFIPLIQTAGKRVTFISSSARVDSGGHWGGTFALGQRWRLDNMLLGSYASYDVRDTGNSTFNQLGLGMELLGDTWDVHFNSYIPIGNTSSQIGDATATHQVLNSFFREISYLLPKEACSRLSKYWAAQI
ncbi:MAG: hypothetical protein HC800_04520 [Phormidesmis sp. RL_2_1]|nr:hypothetical protein [Phormidesmis sp. RL_2_1]